MLSSIPSALHSTPRWAKGDIIRSIISGKPFLVLHIFIDSCTMVADLEARQSPATPIIILPRDYDQYAKDLQMEFEEDAEGRSWSYQPELIV